MEISVKDVAGLLSVSEKTIYRWIKHNKLPAFRIGEQYRFSRAEILEWATSNRINVAAEIFADEGRKDVAVPSLEEALQAGGMHYRVGGRDKTSVLESAISLMPLPAEVDRAFLLKVLLARESLGSTGIGDGIAIPHVRNPIVMHIPRPMITLCFLENPIEFEAIDGKPVNTLFTIVSPVVSAHLSVLSRLAFALRQPVFADVIRRQSGRDEILMAARETDSGMARKEHAPAQEPGL